MTFGLVPDSPAVYSAALELGSILKEGDGGFSTLDCKY